MTIRPAYRELSYPLPMKGGNILRTIPDARAYMLTLGPHRELRNHWRYACQLIMEEADVEVVSNPITGIAGCRAPAGSGYVAAAPPSSVMNYRRLIRLPRRHGRARSAGCRGRALLQS
jgi:hypothetical protein